MLAFLAWPGQSGRESLRIRWPLYSAFFCGVLSLTGQAAEPKAPAADEWKIEIVAGPAIGPSPVPKLKRVVQDAQAALSESSRESDASVPAEIVAAGEDSAMPAGLTTASYLEVYNSIPFRRSEYLANPNYRHEATIELLLGQIRPKTVTNVSAPAATCCNPQAAWFTQWFSPWGSNSFDYRKSRFRP